MNGAPSEGDQRQPAWTRHEVVTPQRRHTFLSAAVAVFNASNYVISTLMTAALIIFYASPPAAAPANEVFSYTNPTHASPEADPVRAALDAVGGANVAISVGIDPCNVNPVTACVVPKYGSVIFVDTNVPELDNHNLLGLMAHEFAHVVTSVWVTERETESTYAYRVFGGDYEWMAECMSVERVGYMATLYAYECSEEQIRVAGNLWNGNWN